MKRSISNDEEIASFYDAECARMIDSSCERRIRLKNKERPIMWHWVVIAVLLVLVVLLWLARYFVHAELMWICEKEFAELENYEEKQKNGKIIEGQKRKMEEIKTNEQPIMPVKALENLNPPPPPILTKLESINPTLIPPPTLPMSPFPTHNPEIKIKVPSPPQMPLPTEPPQPINPNSTIMDPKAITPEQILNAKQYIKLKNQLFLVNNALADKERAYYENKYNISSYSRELPICVVIPSFNNMKDNRYKHNLDSVLMQEYTNYHIVYINDASTDGTGAAVDKYFQEQTVPGLRHMIIHNKQQLFAMVNLRKAANTYCQPHEIFMVVDGDDELLGRQVFKLYNAMFQSEDVWFVYSNWYSVRGAIGFSKEIPEVILKSNTIRHYPFTMSHLRAFYTQLFRNIADGDLKDEKGEYFHAANDVAILFPIVEQSGTNIKYVPELTYVYNSNTGLNNHQIRTREQKNNEIIIRKKGIYLPLEALIFDPV